MAHGVRHAWKLPFPLHIYICGKSQNNTGTVSIVCWEKFRGAKFLEIGDPTDTVIRGHLKATKIIRVLCILHKTYWQLQHLLAGRQEAPMNKPAHATGGLNVDCTESRRNRPAVLRSPRENSMSRILCLIECLRLHYMGMKTGHALTTVRNSQGPSGSTAPPLGKAVGESA